MERNGSNPRLNFILDQVQSNPSVTYQEIESMLEERYLRQVRANERGNGSVLTAIEVLLSQQEVASIMETERHSTQDLQGLDLKVTFNPAYAWSNRLKAVWVQVKSSSWYADSFIEEFGKERLMDRKIVVINGRQPEEAILEDFWKQVWEIYNYKANNY